MATNLVILLTLLMIYVSTSYGYTCPSKCLCQQNKLRCERVKLTITELEEMSISEDITEAYFKTNQLNNITRKALENFAHLTILEISNNGITTLTPKMFQGFNNLKKLTLNDNKISVIKAEMFTGLISLRRLEIERNLIVDLPPGCFDKLYFLQVVRLQKNQIKTVNNGVFTRLNWVRDIFLTENQIDLIQDQAFQNLSLNILDLSINKLETIPVNAFEGLSIGMQLILALNPLNCECKYSMNYARHLSHIWDRIWADCEKPFYVQERELQNAHTSLSCTLCDINTCQNDGKCHGNQTHFSCECKEQFKGDLCEISLCSGQPKVVTKIVEVPGKPVIKYINSATNLPYKQINHTKFITIKENIINKDDKQKLKILYAMCSLEFLVILCFITYFAYVRYRDFKLRKKYEHEKSRKILFNIRNSTNAKLAKSLAAQDGEEGDEEFPFDVKNMILKGSVPV